MANERHCWLGKEEWAEKEFGRFSPEHLAALDEGGTCMLPAGHDGPHAWTPDDEIGITFIKVTKSEL